MLKGCYKNKMGYISLVPVIPVQEVWDTNQHSSCFIAFFTVEGQ